MKSDKHKKWVKKRVDDVRGIRMTGYFHKSFNDDVPLALRKRGCSPFYVKTLIHQNYKSSKERVLYVVDKVPTADLKSGYLLSGTYAPSTVDGVLSQAVKWARKFDRSAYLPAAAWINFNYCKSFHLKGKERDTVTKLSARRVADFVSQYKPDVIVVFGDRAAEALCPKINHVRNKRGWVHRVKLGGRKVKLVNTIDLDDLIPEEYGSKGREMVDKSNMLGIVARHVASAYLGSMPISLRKLSPRPKLVKTMKGWKKLYRKLMKASVVAVDTETENLDVYKNSILTIQFALSPKRGYVVPLSHKDSPFRTKDMEKIKDGLVKFFSRKDVAYSGGKDRKYLVMQNGGFDLRIVRQGLRIPYISWPVFDTISGEYLLEENRGSLSKYGTRTWSLDQLLCNYGNDYYFVAKFSKGDRHTIRDVRLRGSVLDYCSMDVQSDLAIHLCQMRIASKLKLGDQGYLPFYMRMQVVQMSNTIHTMSCMEHRGNEIDMRYLLHIRGKSSPLLRLQAAALDSMRETRPVKRAEKALSRISKLPTKTLFGAASTVQFDLNKTLHKIILFVKVLRLPLEKNSKGNYSFDKNFQHEYSDLAEVKTLTRVNKLRTLYNTFAKGLYQKVEKSEDCKADCRLRPQYGYAGVLTGRSNSFKPSLQQIPEHSDEARVIKRLFITKMGKLKLKLDYSAHEIRGWGIVSGDKVLCGMFTRVNELLHELREKQTDEALTKFKMEGDIHKLNYSGFTGVPVTKVDKKMRQASKGMIFGILYGMASRTLAGRIGVDEDAAEEMMQKLFSKFKKASKWLEWTVEIADTQGYTYSPLGRRRNMPGVFCGFDGLNRAISRRAKNSPIQGIASDFGFDAARLVETGIYKFLVENKLPTVGPDELCIMPAGVTKMVHDSIEVEAPYDLVLPCLWIMEYCAIHGLRILLKKIFDIETYTDFAIEFELGSTGDTMLKWNWTDKGLRNIIKKGITKQVEELGYDLDVKETVDRIYKSGQKYLPYLEETFPLKQHPLLNAA